MLQARNTNFAEEIKQSFAKQTIMGLIGAQLTRQFLWPIRLSAFELFGPRFAVALRGRIIGLYGSGD